MQSAVLGTGSWGTAFAAVLADAGGQVTMWGRREEPVYHIAQHRTNPEYLPDIVLPAAVTASTDIEEVLSGAQLVVLAVPAQTLRDNLSRWRGHIDDKAVVVSLMKGIELSTGKRMSEVIAEHDIAPERIAVVSGPNLAPEIARRQPTATVVGSVSPQTADRLAASCSTRYFRPYTNTDVVGLEVGGSVKNVMGLALGIAEGLGLGHNTQASLITRGLAETARLAEALGAQPTTLAGLAGLGDLVATCMSPLSRNRSVGVRLGRGETLDEIMATQAQTAEGVKSCGAIADMAHQAGVQMPIVEHMAALLKADITVAEIGASLLDRPRKAETH